MKKLYLVQKETDGSETLYPVQGNMWAIHDVCEAAKDCGLSVLALARGRGTCHTALEFRERITDLV